MPAVDLDNLKLLFSLLRQGIQHKPQYKLS